MGGGGLSETWRGGTRTLYTSFVTSWKSKVFQNKRLREREREYGFCTLESLGWLCPTAPKGHYVSWGYTLLSSVLSFLICKVE